MVLHRHRQPLWQRYPERLQRSLQGADVDVPGLYHHRARRHVVT
jgi:hypothetical protein